MSCFKRLALYLVACFAVSSSVSAADLPSGPVQIEPSIPYPEKMTFIVFVREEFSDAIRDQGFVPQDDSSIENRFRLSVRKYGFGMAELVSRQVRPLMTLYAELVNPDNKVLWSNEAAVKSDDKTLAAVLPEDLRNNPDEQEKLLRAAAHRASEKLMENYQQKESKEKPRMDAN